jgi:hypothetical protein
MSCAKTGARTAREATLDKQQAALPDKRYGVILADPEWQFEAYSAETGMDRAADNLPLRSRRRVAGSGLIAVVASCSCKGDGRCCRGLYSHQVSGGFRYA